MSENDRGWIGVDLDGTLAYHETGTMTEYPGEPIMPMLARVRAWITMGKIVKIFTARAAVPGGVEVVRAWLAAHGLPSDMEVTCSKDKDMIELWDDRAVAVQRNTGLTVNDLTLRAERHAAHYEMVFRVLGEAIEKAKVRCGRS